MNALDIKFYYYLNDYFYYYITLCILIVECLSRLVHNQCIGVIKTFFQEYLYFISPLHQIENVYF